MKNKSNKRMQFGVYRVNSNYIDLLRETFPHIPSSSTTNRYCGPVYHTDIDGKRTEYFVPIDVDKFNSVNGVPMTFQNNILAEIMDFSKLLPCSNMDCKLDRSTIKLFEFCESLEPIAEDYAALIIDKKVPKTVAQNFYDIESLSNVFSLCNFRYNENILDVYLLVDDKLDTTGDANDNFVITDEIKDFISQYVYNRNKNFSGIIRYFDLHDYASSIHLITTFGAKDENGMFERLAAENPDFKLLIYDTDDNYSDTIHPYLMGYNSANYDTTMLALYTNEAFWINNDTLAFDPPTARQMRDHNNNMFAPQFKDRMPSYLQRNDWGKANNFKNRENIIRNNMMRSGRHIDVALLNEKMQHVGLKRVLGMLGFQILTSDRIDDDRPIYTLTELAELIAYNTSDVVNLHRLFNHVTYKGNFDLKKGLLHTYPELVYDKFKDRYAPDVRSDNVRRDRLYIDSSSAKLAARTLCPYGNLNDIETVSFMYPSEEKAKEHGIPRVNVLDECRKFFYSLYPNRPDLQAEFDRIYFYYKNNIEGKNFNDSEEYREYWRTKRADKTPLSACSVSDIEKCNLTLPYFDSNGNASSCYVAFGVGGIHGAEYNKTLYDADLAEYNALEDLHNMIRTQFPDPLLLKQKQPGTRKGWSLEHNGITYKASDFLKAGSTATKAEWKDISKKKPALFRPDTKGAFKLNKRYTFTSNDDCNHEDFTSYYPNLLIQMMAFWNDGLGYDRYAEIFGEKERYGKLMKDPSITDEERAYYDNQRNGTKLILNSASGAADACFFTPIRMNNQIMSMRIIGQLFTYRIGQAQTYAGAKITSTNTDGLFTVFEAEENARILERESADIHVAIEPEPCHLVTKDSNNRIEINEKGNIITASGGSLSCYKGPNPSKSLAHAAIIDYALCEYLRNADNIHHATADFLTEAFDMNKGWTILYNSRFAFPEKAKYLNMYQTIVASSVGSQTYIFGETDNCQSYKDGLCGIPFNQSLFETACENGDINIMAHYNRIFFVKREFGTLYGKPIYHLNNAAARVVTPAQKLTRQRLNQIPIQHDPYAKAILEKFNLNEKDIPIGKEAKITKVSGIDPDWYVYIENRSLYELTDDEAQLLIDNLNIDNYLTLICDSFNKNWSNTSVDSDDDGDDPDAA